MMNDFIEELATKDSVVLMRVASTLKVMRILTPEEYGQVSDMQSQQSRNIATQLVYTLYNAIDRKPANAYEIRNVLIRIAQIPRLVLRWEDAGKHLYFLAEPLFMSCALFVNLVRDKKRAMEHQKQVRFSPRAPASGVAGRRMLANVSQNSSNRGFLQSRHLGDLATIT